MRLPSADRKVNNIQSECRSQHPQPEVKENVVQSKVSAEWAVPNAIFNPNCQTTKRKKEAKIGPKISYGQKATV
jgi:hypothetical protein